MFALQVLAMDPPLFLGPATLEVSAIAMSPTGQTAAGTALVPYSGSEGSPCACSGIRTRVALTTVAAAGATPRLYAWNGSAMTFAAIPTPPPQPQWWETPGFIGGVAGASAVVMAIVGLASWAARKRRAAAVRRAAEREAAILSAGAAGRKILAQEATSDRPPAPTGPRPSFGLAN